MKEYSFGAHSSVYQTTDRDIKYFPHADLVKIDDNPNPKHFVKWFYAHKIAGLLYPEHFIKVEGARVYTYSESNIFTRGLAKLLGLHHHRLYSRMADVDQDHAIFSKHYLSIKRGDSLCKCEVCKKHFYFHIYNNLEHEAGIISNKVDAAGIRVPIYDPSDYCLSGNNLVFFEITSIVLEYMGSYFDGLNTLTSNQEEALRLFSRLEILNPGETYFKL